LSPLDEQTLMTGFDGRATLEAMKSIELSTRHIGRRAGHASDQVVHETAPWIEGLGRWGHVAIGLVYATIGVLAAQTALSSGGDTTDSHGALGWIVQAPFGRVILAALALGFAGYATWRFMQTVRDTESKGATPMGILNRLAYACIGLTYGALALSALELARGRAESGEGSGDAAAQDWTAWLLAQPFGQVLVAAAGLGIIGVSLVQFYLAYSGKCCDSLQTSELKQTQERLVRAGGRIGFSARGISLGIVGVLLLVAAYDARSDDVRGLGGALATLAQQPFGPWLLGVVACGLVVYGAFMMVKARYGRLVVR
jgi:hypothetical protein